MKRKIGVISGLVIILLGLFALPRLAAPASPTQEKTQAEALAESMTLEEKVGQMFLACVSDSGADPEDISTWRPGGYLFFADFFESRSTKEAADRIAAFQDAAKIPMLMAVDEEGGTVTRVSRFPAYRGQPFASPMELYRSGGLAAVLEDTEEKSSLLLSLGVNVNLAPVCDMTEDKDSFIYARTLGQDAETTAEYTAAVVKSMKESGIGSALKHFPGYGGNADTHTGIATDTRDYDQFLSHDFLPFQAGIEAGAPCVMVSHNIVTCMDAEVPASLSSEVHRILRETLGFEGVILTDDLSMDGVQDYIDDEDMAVAAIQAGNDLLCASQYQTQIPAVIDAVKSGELSEEQITDSVIRILRWKQELGLLK
ncbi:beta-hexosaminidase [bacterium 210820-DFI.6.37]|nr:beta-hexosaminidase [bacterium 210820-DFI.6.37]